jgi:hypothetical protein
VRNPFALLLLVFLRAGGPPGATRADVPVQNEMIWLQSEWCWRTDGRQASMVAFGPSRDVATGLGRATPGFHAGGSLAGKQHGWKLRALAERRQQGSHKPRANARNSVPLCHRERLLRTQNTVCAIPSTGFPLQADELRGGAQVHNMVPLLRPISVAVSCAQLSTTGAGLSLGFDNAAEGKSF